MRFQLHAALAALLLAAGSAHAQLLMGGKTDLAARVNGEPIKLVEVQAILDARPAPVKLTAEQERAARRAAVDMLVDDALMRQFLRAKVQLPASREIERAFDDFREAL